MSLEYAAEKVGTAVSILTTGKGRILDRLRSAYEESVVRVDRDDIPAERRDLYDRIMKDLTWIKNDSPPPDEDEATITATLLEDLSCLLDDELV